MQPELGVTAPAHLRRVLPWSAIGKRPYMQVPNASPQPTISGVGHPFIRDPYTSIFVHEMEYASWSRAT